MNHTATLLAATIRTIPGLGAGRATKRQPVGQKLPNAGSVTNVDREAKAGNAPPSAGRRRTREHAANFDQPDLTFERESIVHECPNAEGSCADGRKIGVLGGVSPGRQSESPPTYAGETKQGVR